jgi:hypothetical protein
MGWTAGPDDRFFDPKTIFSYIDGAGEVYKAYNMRRCLSRRYTHPEGPTIIMDIFDMGSSEDAFGVFTHDTAGEMLNIGQDARMRPGWLSFWKNRFFVSIYMEEESAEAEKAVKDLGRQIAAHIPAHGSKPDILSQLPPQGLISDSIRFLHHPVVLNYHYYLADENILNLSKDADAVLATYRRGREDALLLLVMYPSSQIAQKALASFLKYYLPEAEPRGPVVLENGKWAAALVSHRLLTIVLEADSKVLARELLKPFI